MTLFTGKGDQGSTKLFNSKKDERISKSAPIFDALGSVDELNTVIGWCRGACSVDWFVNHVTVGDILITLQQHLFIIQAELAGAKKNISAKQIKELEQWIHNIDKELPDITSFFLPGGSELSSRLDVARAVARRAERSVIALSETQTKVSAHTCTYMNRLSSVLYALVRFVNFHSGEKEIPPTYNT